MLECVVNVSEGARPDAVAALAESVADHLLDVHTDRHHNRTVFTLVGTDAPRRLAAAAISMLDLRVHRGVHPRLGVVDVVPFVPLAGATLEDAEGARDGFAVWAAETLRLPCFLYGRERSLPDIRRRAFVDLAPDAGPPAPHPTAGACCVGARGVLVAYNVWLDPAEDPARARAVAREVRGPDIRALGLQVGDRCQVSMNLVNPAAVGPLEAYDRVAALARVERGELVGLLPASVLDRIPEERWDQLDVSPSRTIEARLERL